MIGKNPRLMNRNSAKPFLRLKARTAAVWAVMALGVMVPAVADQVLMQNGDRYNGHIFLQTGPEY